MLTKKVIVSSVSIFALTLLLPNQLQTKNAIAVEQNTQFQVNVRESLVVSITTPATWATGDVDQFLRNKINVSVSTNNADGFTASMTTKTSSTDLVHVADKGTIPTLASSSAKSSFPTNRWGYSLNDTDQGNDSSTYNALVGASSTPITLISRTESQTVSNKDVWFGAKADTSKPSGTYVSTVVISVVTGVIDNNTNPTTPTNPAQPDSNENTANYSGTGTTTGNTTNGSTTYTYRRNSGSGSSATSATTTEVSDGDNRNAYVGYTPPQGVTTRQTTTESVSDGSSLATGLAIASATAATSGALFFILAKRKKDDDDEEEEQQ